MVQKISLGEFSCSIGGFKHYELIYGDVLSPVRTELCFDSITVELGVDPFVMFSNKDKGYMVLRHLRRVEQITPIGLNMSYRLYSEDFRDPKKKVEVSCVINCF